MKVGVPTAVKNNEYRVAFTPARAFELTARGHDVYVQAGARLGSSSPDDTYRQAGATILGSTDDVWVEGNLIVKVKEPISGEYERLRDDQVLFTYLHLSASRECTDALLASGVNAFAYETVEIEDRRRPLLVPMSEVAGPPPMPAPTTCSESPGDVPGVRPGARLELDGGPDEARCRARRPLHRPRRVLRGQPPDHPCRSHVRRPRDVVLLRREHARSRARTPPRTR